MNLDQRPINLAAGVHEYGPFTIPDDVTEVKLILARKTTAEPGYWDDGVQVNLDSLYSMDGGTTWLEGMGFRGEGGIYLFKRDGTESPETWVRGKFPPGTGRLIRVIVTITGGRLVSRLTVEVT